jgi:hypothetical protein
MKRNISEQTKKRHRCVSFISIFDANLAREKDKEKETLFVRHGSSIIKVGRM